MVALVLMEAITAMKRGPPGTGPRGRKSGGGKKNNNNIEPAADTQNVKLEPNAQCPAPPRDVRSRKQTVRPLVRPSKATGSGARPFVCASVCGAEDCAGQGAKLVRSPDPRPTCPPTSARSEPLSGRLESRTDVLGPTVSFLPNWPPVRLGGK